MHLFDYAAVGFLIACMIWAGAMALHKARGDGVYRETDARKVSGRRDGQWSFT